MQNNTIYKLTIKCVWGAYLKDDFIRVVEVPSSINLGNLRDLIHKLSGFDYDHLDTFYVARRVRGKKLWFDSETNQWIDEPEDDNNEALWEICLHDIFPIMPDKNLYYWFDFGDDWKFEIKKWKKESSPQSGITYPRVVSEKGPQIEQYPAFDEDEY